jgi:hypothetical protein
MFMPEPCYLPPHYPKLPPNSLEHGLAPKRLHLTHLPTSPTWYQFQRHDSAQAIPASSLAIASHPPTQQNITPSLETWTCPMLPPAHGNARVETICRHPASSHTQPPARGIMKLTHSPSQTTFHLDVKQRKAESNNVLVPKSYQQYIHGNNHTIAQTNMCPRMPPVHTSYTSPDNL